MSRNGLSTNAREMAEKFEDCIVEDRVDALFEEAELDEIEEKWLDYEDEFNDESTEPRKMRRMEQFRR